MRIETTVKEYRDWAMNKGFLAYDCKLSSSGWIVWGFIGNKHTIVVVKP